MGLDQYLTARRYIGCWDHGQESERKTYAQIARSVGKPGWINEGSPHLYVEMSVAYWRKANAIHKWFVDTVQDGEDDCGNYEVSREELSELRQLCQAVLDGSKLAEGIVENGQTWTAGTGTVRNFEPGKIVADPSVAQEVLPTQGGFFFGSTSYDEYYVQDLRDTVAQLDKVLATFDGDWNFQYHSSW